ncbi:MAG: hypothetical protein WCB51_11255 [Candidatus Dormiibacterota bacterium]
MVKLPQQRGFRRLVSKLNADRHDNPVRFKYNNPLQFVVVGAAFVVIGVLSLPLTSFGLGLIPLGLVILLVVALYYYLR